jgi:hypothetical protein
MGRFDRDNGEPWIPQRGIRQDMQKGYDTAQVCLNGHTTNDSTVRFSEFNKNFCKDCGAATITQCPHCNVAIRGRYHGAMAVAAYQAPAFCQECGKPFPCTESRMEAAMDLAGQLGLDIPERVMLEESIDEIVRDTPKATAEAVRFRSIVDKAGPWALDAFKNILVSIAADGVKHIIWPK